ncbi:similar to Saccharomyces cerevisiae YJL098W SAP185 Protein that forms a complex with the Sit4p protein phosphatase and is required for its function [Maudiozyma saulgeensis]|uniref:Similar to Saccharomyces cerevisiae YJL098W SAP185 Protein that forms a complex with the Sit4p protein phosphatase and is required for its function n=1 Tax=Maudiozyma saulgeensis TaxID=1789683 RepID=A0A1X7R8Z8_9SACH|nr:similar to Saccharomyces cerevisiae YJL098W SAP185 Protein that forms a complex with the Sit4p protein phosphatase and is required for its function [Kazachstania saulgeensis]
MSGSFWKFGQDYSSESSVSRILNRAFIKIHKDGDDNESITSQQVTKATSETGSNVYSESSDIDLEQDSEKENDTTIVKLPDQEEEYENYKPNLDVIDELLDDEEMYTELMCSNFQLLIYLKYPQVLDKLIDYVITEHKRSQTNMSSTSDDSNDDNNNNDKKTEVFKTDEQQKQEEEDERENGEETEEDAVIRRANMAAEILSADVWQISTALTERSEILDKLWSVVKKDEPISTDISTYFMKINERLLDTDMTSMINFIKNQQILVDKCLLHIANPPLMDFLLKLISTDKPDEPNGVLHKLKQEEFIPKLLKKLGPECDATTQCAAADFLKAFIAISGNCIDEVASGIGPNELTRELASHKVMSELIANMLKGGTCLSNGVGIIIELIRKNNSDYDYVQVMHTTLETHPPNDRDPIYLGHMLKLFAENIHAFNDILVETTTPILDTSFGRIEPVGFERFKICELVAELLHCSNMSLLNEKKAPQIIEERDHAREILLKKQLEEAASPDGEEMTSQLNSLQLNSSQPMDQDDVTQETIEESDVIDDSDEAMKDLRETPVVGDRLKIALSDTQIITTILEMLFHFKWNNFLHNVVFDIIQQVFNGPLKISFNKFLIRDLLVNAEITKLIINGDLDSNTQEEENHLRLGYMGHLTLVAEEIVKFSIYLDELKLTFVTPVIAESLADEQWKEYVNTTLMTTREKYDMVLGEVVDENGEIINDMDNVDENEYDQPDENLDEHIENENAGNLDENINNDEEHDDIDIEADDSFEDMYEAEEEDKKLDDVTGDNEDSRFDKYMSDELGRTTSTGSAKRTKEDHGPEYLDVETNNNNVDGNKSDSKSFLINGLRKRSHPASPELHDEDIFQQQYNPAYRKSNSDDEDYDHSGNSSNSSSDSNNSSASSSSDSSNSNNNSGNNSTNNSDNEEETVESKNNDLHRVANVAYSQVLSPFEDDELSDDSDAELEENLDDEYAYNSNDEDDDEDEDVNDDYEAYSLCRSTSKENVLWNDDDSTKASERR